MLTYKGYDDLIEGLRYGFDEEKEIARGIMSNVRPTDFEELKKEANNDKTF